MTNGSIEQLKLYLEKTKPGKIADVSELVPLLRECWDQFEGSEEENMQAWKLDRIEDVSWDPPLLSFIIERHGGTVLGSTRADKQRWDVDLDGKTAKCYSAGPRQLYPRSPPLNVQPIAEEIAALLINRRQDDRLKWRADGTVQVLTGKIIPDEGPKQTVNGRRKRFREALVSILEPLGWGIESNFFRPPE